MMNDLNRLGLSEARDTLKRGDATAVDLTRSCLAAIEAAGALNAVAHLSAEIALDRARAADARLAQGDAPDLCGVPIGVKDMFCTKGVPTQAASRILEGFVPDYESTVTQKLADAGAVMLGKLNMDEFAMGASNETSVHGPVVSPWRRGGDTEALSPGGSSGGSAAAVAADLCLAATGTDTAGSIRLPAAFCGITGLKPTWGRCSRWGMIALASSLDQAGPMVKSVRDAAIMLAAMAGHDPKDSTSSDRAVPDYEAALGASVAGRTIGIPREYRTDSLTGEVDELWQKGAAILRDAGAKVVEISLPHTQYALPAYHVIAPAEASSNLARYDGVRFGYRARLAPGDSVNDMYDKTRAEGFGHEVQRRLMFGTYMLSAECYDSHYERARKLRRLVRGDFDSAFAGGVDAILTPTAASAAFALGAHTGDDPVQMFENDLFTVPANLAGLPAISLPGGQDGAGLPLGLQLIGRPWAEDDLLNLAFVLEAGAGFVAKPERWW
ncbi:aspartyl/glutamyl-tRNA(Asn/Gln) amidotransferase subunit A [Pontibaca methylaminivorans]|uniref:Glutamyl-tRNA(Gln) amidotransferase subunit A n=2 Tax=Pontibaca methylaminivorans TaxID=515897 RepID=A0A1R3WK79_9RHOB|nr:aspartyl/glutamyl-tRNA(Asn/Gln) amidotransferase subunit A [Pontibaca methylaminivorans]